jgi:Fe-S-cluster containining protein
MRRCRAGCCRGPLFLPLTAAEAESFRSHASRLGVVLRISNAAEGAFAVRFSDHQGEHCPMLDDASSACRIYADRPQRCREFPGQLRPDCELSQLQFTHT